ncbi:uncharacterized protein PV09_05146 [Verruconis gallopava]|uniref:Magnesium and cobalt transporter CorA n=1 Tax=Verruconis gallopava TaxID=253628 RepID=A0A0D1YT84_9PEZI|nr:uncharacterized protein PV09_05146 [Verruconis gallopava]KIW03847.1 hypothetical protein PV09_05146 [Verruconis gallopava]
MLLCTVARVACSRPIGQSSVSAACASRILVRKLVTVQPHSSGPPSSSPSLPSIGLLCCIPELTTVASSVLPVFGRRRMSTARKMADPVIRDFQATRTRSATDAPSARPNVDLEQNAAAPGPRRYNTLAPTSVTGMATGFNSRARAHSLASTSSINSDDIVERRITRHDTVRRYSGTYDLPMRDHEPVWEEPGAEPGIDTSKEPESRFSHILQECQITVVDLFEDHVSKFELDNEGLAAFLKDQPSQEPYKARWINVNRLSYDVITMLQAEYKLHGLAIEDMLSIRGRTKVDWYADHAFIFMTLQKLIKVKPLDQDVRKAEQAGRRSTFRRMFTRRDDPILGLQNEKLQGKGELGASGYNADGPRPSAVSASGRPYQNHESYRTLQRNKPGQNFERMLYMERNSMLTQKNLAVSVEKVAIFLTANNTVISFFEHSADDIEGPILRRLNSPNTILRTSSDASMMVQAVIDAIVDLAIPVVAAYEDIISELEVDVLTDPEMAHSRRLYIVASELSLLRANLAPISVIISAIRDHQRSAARDKALREREHHDVTNNPARPGVTRSVTRVKTVNISETAVTYFGDVEDHIISMSSHLDNMRRTASDLIDLLYNQMGAFQNETMKMLTAVTIFFLPLTFLTGYFGQNFEHFEAIKHSDAFFWMIALPVMAVTMVVLTGPIWIRFAKRQLQKAWIFRQKKARNEKLRRTNTIGTTTQRTNTNPR